MSGEVVNLRAARKARERREAEATAAGNRARFGRTKGQRARDTITAERVERIVEGAKLDPQ